MAIRGIQISLNSKPTMVYIVNFFFVKKTLTRFTRLAINMWSSNLSSQQLGLLTCVTTLDNKYVLKPFFLKIRLLSHTFDSSSWKSETGESLSVSPALNKEKVPGQPELHGGLLSISWRKKNTTFKWIMLQIWGV